MANAVIKDRGWIRISRNIHDLGNQSVKVGLLSGGPSQGGTPIVHYAYWNEFGTENIPSRPFLRRTIDEQAKTLASRNGKFAQLVRELISARLNTNQCLDWIGLYFQNEIRKTIRTSASWAAPNSAYTIQLKGSSTPLIDHAMLIGAVNYQKTRF